MKDPKKHNPCFRLMYPGETLAHYKAAMSLWIDAMKRNGYTFD